MLIKKEHTKERKKRNSSFIMEFLLKPHTLKSLTTLAFIKHIKYSGSGEEL